MKNQKNCKDDKDQIKTEENILLWKPKLLIEEPMLRI